MTKYLRFQGQGIIGGTRSNFGVFMLAGKLRDDPATSAYDAEHLKEQLNWFNQHLSVPPVFRDSKNYRAICWFKDSAHKPLSRIWAIKTLLAEYGLWIEHITTNTPGYVIYEDDWQIAAKPFRDNKH